MTLVGVTAFAQQRAVNGTVVKSKYSTNNFRKN